MPRLLAFGDTQLGVQTVDLADQREVLDRIVQVALQREVDSVLHGGDVFEGPVVTPEQLRTFIDSVRPLHDAGIPLLVQRGNGRHDLATREVHALDVFKDYDGITVSDSPAVCVLADKVAVCCLPWVHPGRLIASMNGSLTHEEADLTTAQMLVRIARHQFEQVARLKGGSGGPSQDIPTVLLAHWAISGSALPTGLSVDEMREPILPWADLDAIGYDAIIGAHIHKGQRIDNPEIDRTLGVVVGSPQPLNHGEGGYDHGVWIIDIPALAEPVAGVGSSSGVSASVGERAATQRGPIPGSASSEFVPIQSKYFTTHDYNPEMPVQPFVSGDIVRVRYTATEEEARRIDHEAIRRAYMEGPTQPSRITIEPTIIRKERARAQQISEELSPVDALAEYCDANDVEPDRALAMLARLKEWSE